MSDFRQIGAIALLLWLGACAPVEEPVTVAAPIVPVEETKPEAKADAIPEADTEAEITAPSDNQTAQIEDNASQILVANKAPVITQEVTAKEVTAEIEAPKEITPVKITPVKTIPAPLPDPFNPLSLIGQPNTALGATLGASDYSYDNSGMTISHYRAEACIVLVFSAPNNARDEITHIDVRHPIVGAALDEIACYQELGAKKAALK